MLLLLHQLKHLLSFCVCLRAILELDVFAVPSKQEGY